MADSRQQASPPPAQESGWALKLGSVSGIPIRLHFTFFLLLLWFAIRDNGPESWRGILYVLGIFACVVLHELGHSLVAQRFGIGVRDITLYPIGGIARMERLPNPYQELWITLAGPAVNLVIAAVLYVVLQARGALIPWEQLTMGGGYWWQKLLLTNVVLFLFNMIPAFPMDGGRILRALLALRLGELRATETAASIGQFLAIAFGFFGLFYNPLLLFIAFFVFLGAGQEAAMYRQKALVEGVPVRAAMITEFRTLPVGASLREAAERLLESSQTDYPVVNGEEIVGLLSRQDLLRGLTAQGPTGYVAGAMTRDFLTVSPDADLEEIAMEMQSGRRPAILVMEEGRLLGLVTMENLAELLVVRQILNRSTA